MGKINKNWTFKAKCKNNLNILIPIELIILTIIYHRILLNFYLANNLSIKIIILRMTKAVIIYLLKIAKNTHIKRVVTKRVSSTLRISRILLLGKNNNNNYKKINKNNSLLLLITIIS